MSEPQRVEWPTLGLLLMAYGLWIAAGLWVASWSLSLAIVMTSLAAAMHSSLQHEALHGHPTPWRWLNDALVFPALTLCIPYFRFRDTHLEHHRDANLTDPYDDPESNFLDPDVWAALTPATRAVLRFNNTLLGRMLIGPVVSQISFMRGDWAAIRRGEKDVLAAWIWHVPAVAIVLWWMGAVSNMPVWAALVATYGALSILKIRTYLEHRAHERARGRTVIIEDRGLLALIFLNNNFHVVHHMHPRAPWYRLPKLYFKNPDCYLRRNDGYRYRSYAEVFGRYFLKAKDPVPHPLWRR